MKYNPPSSLSSEKDVAPSFVSKSFTFCSERGVSSTILQTLLFFFLESVCFQMKKPINEAITASNMIVFVMTITFKMKKSTLPPSRSASVEFPKTDIGRGLFWQCFCGSAIESKSKIGIILANLPIFASRRGL